MTTTDKYREAARAALREGGCTTWTVGAWSMTVAAVEAAIATAVEQETAALRQERDRLVCIDLPETLRGLEQVETERDEARAALAEAEARGEARVRKELRGLWRVVRSRLRGMEGSHPQLVAYVEDGLRKTAPTSGGGEEACKKCGGSGDWMDGRKCSACLGSGKAKEPAPCPTCGDNPHGVFRAVLGKMIPCPTCQPQGGRDE